MAKAWYHTNNRAKGIGRSKWNQPRYQILSQARKQNLRVLIFKRNEASLHATSNSMEGHFVRMVDERKINGTPNQLMEEDKYKVPNIQTNPSIQLEVLQTTSSMYNLHLYNYYINIINFTEHGSLFPFYLPQISPYPNISHLNGGKTQRTSGGPWKNRPMQTQTAAMATIDSIAGL